jgi:hypothetical protein
LSSGSDGGLANEETIEQSAMSSRIIATERTIETLSGAKPDGADAVAIIEPQDAEDIPVGLFSPAKKTRQ